MKTTQAPRRKSYSTQKPVSKKCNCPYCGLKGGAAENSSSTAFKKPASSIEVDEKPSSSATSKKQPSLIGNPKYKSNSLSSKECATDNDIRDNTRKVQLANAPSSNRTIGKEMHECVCGNSYSRKDDLLRHVKFCETVKANSSKRPEDAPESSKIKCVCGMGFDCVYNLVRHKTENCSGRRTVEKSFKCECRFVFDDLESLVEHQKTVCKKRVGTGTDSTSKSSIKGEQNLTCECGLSYMNIYTLLKHKSTACVLNKYTDCPIVPNELTHSCECGRKFARSSDLARHKSVCDLRESSGNEFDSDVEVKEEDGDNGGEDGNDSSHRKQDSAGVNPNSSHGTPRRNFLCRCGEPFSAYSNIVDHLSGSCPSANDSVGTFLKCRCGREFPKLCYLGRHQVACDLTPKVESGLKVEEVRNLRCECGKTFVKLCGLASHKRSFCRLRKTALPSSSNSKSKSGGSSHLTGRSHMKVARNRCKCGAQFTSPSNLSRHIRNKNTTEKIQAGRPAVSKRVRGSKVINSRKWGIVRGPPFVCKCGASYLNYVSFSFHKRQMCKISDTNQTAKPKTNLANKPAVGDNHEPKVKLDPVDTTDYPKVGEVFDLSTAMKFKCVCGQEFYSKFSLNGHSKQCKDFLAKKRTGEKCAICKATFLSRAHLVRHVKYMHCGVSNIKVGTKVKKIVAKSPKSSPKPHGRGLVIQNVRSLASSP